MVYLFIQAYDNNKFNLIANFFLSIIGENSFQMRDFSIKFKIFIRIIKF